MSSLRSSVVSSLLAPSLLFALGGDARAQTAEERFAEGSAAMDDGDFPTACAAFRASFEQSGSKGAMYNLAKCEDEGRLGRLASSLTHWREVQERFGDKPDIRAEAEGRVTALEQRVARLTLRRAPTLPAGVVTALDGKAAGFDAPIPVDAGHHVVEVSLTGRTARRFGVDIADGERKELVVSLDEAASPRTRPDTAEDPGDDGGTRDGSSGLRPAAWISGGLGVVGLALFAVSLPIQAGAESDIEAACVGEGRTECGPAAAEAADRGETWQAVGGVGLGVGVVGLALGATFFVLSSGDGETSVSVRGDRVVVGGSF